MKIVDYWLSGYTSVPSGVSAPWLPIPIAPQPLSVITKIQRAIVAKSKYIAKIEISPSALSHPSLLAFY